jgi:stage IV sporulation protein B
MTKRSIKLAFSLLLIFAMTALTLTSVSAPATSDSLPCINVITPMGGHISGVSASDIRMSSRNIKDAKLYVGGFPFGVKFMTDGVIVVGLCEINTTVGAVNPARDAGLRQNDVILKVGGATIADAASLTHAAEICGGKALEIVYSRDGNEAVTTLTPALCKDDGRYKTGMYVRDSGAGIGTVTYVIPETLSFGGLGHGICDSDTGKLIPMQRGSVVGVTINGVVKGLSGTPGEVKGYFSSGKTGTLLKNTDCGVFGAFVSMPSDITPTLLPIGTRNEVKCGKAYIMSTLDGTCPQKYEIEISDIRQSSTTNKCFTVKVTDKALLDKTGGIIQGMSGSPIIQNGKIIGAVTHVLVNDPTTGYGIFIENMLNAAQVPIAKAS